MSSAYSQSYIRRSSPKRSSPRRSSPQRSPHRYTSPQRATGDMFAALSDESILKVLHKLNPTYRQQWAEASPKVRQVYNKHFSKSVTQRSPKRYTSPKKYQSVRRLSPVRSTYSSKRM